MAVRVCWRALVYVAIAIPMLGADTCSVSVGAGGVPDEPMRNEYDPEIDGQWEVLLSGPNVVELVHPERDVIPGDWRRDLITLEDGRVVAFRCRDRDLVCPLEVLGLVPTGLLRIEDRAAIVVQHEDPSFTSFGDVDEQSHPVLLFEDGSGTFLLSNDAAEAECGWRAEIMLAFVNDDLNFVRAEALVGEVTIEYDADCLLTPEGEPLSDDDEILIVSETFDAQWAPI